MENLRICRNCLKGKSILFFHKRKKPNGNVCFRTLCHDCENAKRREGYHLKDKHNPRYLEVRKKYRELNKEKARIWVKKTYQKNRVRDIERAIQHRKNKQSWFWSQVKPECGYCGYKESRAALQFHHLERNQKNGVRDSLATWVRKLSFEALKQKVIATEFAILCANCHAKHHAECDSSGYSEIVGYTSVMGRTHPVGGKYD